MRRSLPWCAGDEVTQLGMTCSPISMSRRSRYASSWATSCSLRRMASPTAILFSSSCTLAALSRRTRSMSWVASRPRSSSRRWRSRSGVLGGLGGEAGLTLLLERGQGGLGLRDAVVELVLPSVRAWPSICCTTSIGRTCGPADPAPGRAAPGELLADDRLNVTHEAGLRGVTPGPNSPIWGSAWTGTVCCGGRRLHSNGPTRHGVDGVLRSGFWGEAMWARCPST